MDNFYTKDKCNRCGGSLAGGGLCLCSMMNVFV